ncbi:MAG: type II secretion system protein M [Candidatus Methylomirabilis sp.]|nr:type II secretion system protein M [Deltaproteobacteria bacterium]
MIAWFRSLSDRERWMVIGAAVTLVLALLYRFGPDEDADVTARRMEKAQSDLETMRKLASEHAGLLRDAARLEGLTLPDASFNLVTTLTGMAEAQGIQKVSSKSPRATPLDEQYTERVVEIALQDARLAQLVGLLHAVEESKEPLRVKRMRVKPQTRDPNLLDVNLTVATYTTGAS